MTALHNDTDTLATIATTNPAAARVFERPGLDYCCHGQQTLGAAWRDAEIDVATIAAELGDKEEVVLFPAIEAFGCGRREFPFGSIANPIRMMTSAVGGRFSCRPAAVPKRDSRYRRRGEGAGRDERLGDGHVAPDVERAAGV